MYVHIGLNVTDLAKSIDFYSKVFDAEPIKVKPDYAKFLLESPPVNFALNQQQNVNGNQVSHFGFQVKDTDAVSAHRDRLQGLGLTTRDEMNVTCCYSVQDKFWVEDPDGNEWEFFVPKADSQVHSAPSSSVCCAR